MTPRHARNAAGDVAQNPPASDAIEDRRCVPFAQIEVSILRDPTLSPQPKALYGLLITYGPERIFPGHERLAQEMGVTERTIRRWLIELRDHDLIDWIRRGSTSNLYTILGPNYVDRTNMSDQSGQECPVRPDTDVRRSRSSYLDPDTEDEEEPSRERDDFLPPYYTLEQLLEQGISERKARRIVRNLRKGDSYWIAFLVSIGLTRKNAQILLDRVGEERMEIWQEYLKANPKSKPAAYLWQAIMTYGDLEPPET